MKPPKVVFNSRELAAWLDEAMKDRSGFLAMSNALHFHQVRFSLGQRTSGWRLTSLPRLAARVLLINGKTAILQSEASRSASCQVLFGSEELPELKYFKAELLSRGPGYAEAFSATIRDLDDLGTSAKDKLADLPRIRDVQAVRKVLDRSGPGEILVEAGRLLKKDASVLQIPVLVVLTKPMSPAEAHFLESIPNLQTVFLAARPIRPEMEKRLGPAVFKAIDETRRTPTGETDLEVLQAYLFERPRILLEEGRKKAGKPDETVRIEIASGAEEEIQAAAAWVHDEAVKRKTALDELAVLVSDPDPYLPMLYERLRRLPWPAGGSVPVFVHGGLPALHHPSGARLQTLLTSLQSSLNVREVARVLPTLQIDAREGESPYLSSGLARKLAWSSGTLGGTPGRAEGAKEWKGALERRQAGLSERIKQWEGKGAGEDKEGEDRSLRDDRRALRLVIRAKPAITALQDMAELVLANRPLEDLWPAVESFVNDFASISPRLFQPFSERIELLLRDQRVSKAPGVVALGILQSQLDSLRLAVGEFGQAQVYLGTIAGAVGLGFRAVRILGLSEGSVPAPPSEDPVLPDDDRVRIKLPGIRLRRDATWESLHAFYRVVQGVGERLVLSAPRDGEDRQTREPSGVFLEVAAALGRHKWDPKKLFQPSMPGLRTSNASLEDLQRMSELVTREGNVELMPADGVLPNAWPTVPYPGLSADRPLSAKQLKDFLECPHEFLLRRVLGWDEPEAEPSVGELDAITFGSLLHEVAEEFWNEHGREFCAHTGTSEDWVQKAIAIGEQAFDRLMESYPLIGRHIHDQERRRLRRAVEQIAEVDWAKAPHDFVLAEFGFGWKDPAAVNLGEGRILFARGYIDRVEKLGSGVHSSIVDVKSGRGKLKKDGPDHRIDAQIGFYSVVLDAIRKQPELDLPAVGEAGYVYNDRVHPERTFRDDFDDLKSNTIGWLRLAHSFLGASQFPRTIDPKADCKYCPFKKVCPRESHRRALDGMVGKKQFSAFLELKGHE